ncbi:MAG: carbohydrate kinase family protein [Cyanobacteria bacterium SZAS LIN-3]|nr:carbohydrate kinase family protein [Cyanobacteria bacterium SZAS LIN-3]
MGSILVIGCVSLDTIHLEQSGQRETFKTIGGAGLFTALAAAKSGAQVTLYAPKPQPMPALLSPIETMLSWQGPTVAPENMPTLEIIHHGGGRATLLGASWGPEQMLTLKNLDQLLHDEINKEKTFAAVHVAALSSAGRQLEFIKHWRNCDTGALLSAGTYARAINNDKQAVLDLIRNCDIFFMNSNEAGLLSSEGESSGQKKIIPAPGQTIFITDGENGATILSDTFNESTRHIAATAADEQDPTGAGDTFCGATLASIVQGMGVIQSAQAGANLAAKIIEKPGSSYYF